MLAKEILKLSQFKKKFNSSNKNDFKISNDIFNNEEALYWNIEKLPTITKIFIVQNLLKEMISIKNRFVENKEKMKEKIDSNCFNYFKNAILIKEITDYCDSKNPEIPINYILLKNANEILYSFEEKDKDINFIEDFFFELRNDNALMLKIIEQINSSNYEQLCYFMVHFLYENATSGSFFQDELMIITYLILENIIYKKLPQVINQKTLNKDNEQDKNKLFLYSYLKAFTRKPEIRNYLCYIFRDNILKIENEKKILHLNTRTILKALVDEENEKETIFNNIRKKTVLNESVEKLLKGKQLVHQSTLLQSTVSDKITNDSKVRHSVGLINMDSRENINKNMDNKDNTILDQFFKEQDFTQILLSRKLYQINNKNKNEIDNAYMEYLLSLKDEYHKNNNNIDIFSNILIASSFKETRIKQEKISLEELGNTYKDNYNKIINFVEELFNKINDNIKTLPYTIKCMYYIIKKLIDNKYSQKEGHITMFQKLLFKIRFFFGGFILPILASPLYNGIISDNIISKYTKENLNIIFKIIEKIISGNLFNITNGTADDPIYTIFNKFISDKMYTLFEIITNFDNYIENNFEPPSIILNLLYNYRDKNRNINYDYFGINNDENIRYQCACFSSSDLMMFVNVLESFKENEMSKNQNLIKKYKKIFNERYIKNKNNNIEEYIFVSKFWYRESFLNEIKSVTEDHFENYFKNQKSNDPHLEELSRLKKCLIEILIYINKLHKENFNPFIKRKDELILCHNSNINKILNYKKSILYNDTIFEGDTNYSINSLTGSFHIRRDFKKALAEDSLEDADFLKEIFPRIMSSIKYEIGNNFDNPKQEHIIFCVSYLQLHIGNLTEDYVVNNYSKLFIDIMKDLEKLIKSLQNNILNQFYLKIRGGDELNLIISNECSQIKNIEKYFCIEYLFNKLNVPDPFEEMLTKTPSISTKDITVLLSEYSISMFIKQFPDYRKNEHEIDDIIEQENSKNIPNILKKYFKDIRNLIKNEKIISKFSPEEYLSICYELENYILFRLYDKLYPTIESSKDRFIYKKCKRLSFIKPENYIKDKKMINENTLKTVIEYINDMDNKYTPVDKIKTFGKAFGLLQSSMAFISGKKDFGIDDTLPTLIYVILKAQPKMINTNFNYCKYYINPELDKKVYGILLMQIGMVIKIITEMKHTDLIGVTEEEFGSDKEIPPEIRRSNNLQPKYMVNE